MNCSVMLVVLLLFTCKYGITTNSYFHNRVYTSEKEFVSNVIESVVLLCGQSDPSG